MRKWKRTKNIIVPIAEDRNASPKITPMKTAAAGANTNTIVAVGIPAKAKAVVARKSTITAVVSAIRANPRGRTAAAATAEFPITG